MAKAKSFKGFTLIEILVVVALIAILTAITFIAINPAKNFADTRNAQRSSDVTQILNAITQYTSESGHSTDDFDTNIAIPLCTTTSAPIGPTACATCVVLEGLLVDDYIVGIPSDPLDTNTADGYGYEVCQTDGGRIQVDAPSAEEGKTISVKR